MDQILLKKILDRLVYLCLSISMVSISMYESVVIQLSKDVKSTRTPDKRGYCG